MIHMHRCSISPDMPGRVQVPVPACTHPNAVQGREDKVTGFTSWEYSAFGPEDAMAERSVTPNRHCKWSYLAGLGVNQ